MDIKEPKMKRTYENAMKILHSRRRKVRPKAMPVIDGLPVIGEMPSIKGTPTFSGISSLVGVRHWLQILGHSDNDVNKLNVIHVAGTKGKGSTCAFVRSFLRAHSLRTGFPRRVGLYTSPDLRCIRERIQINDEPIVEDLFTKYFFEVWDQLSVPDSQSAEETGRVPRYLQLLALVAVHSFIREEVDAAIFETHHGGEYDVTNVVQNPIVTGITNIGMDHVAQLGPSIENIAWHKAGIFKPSAAAFSTMQEPSVNEVLRRRAVEKGVELKFVQLDPSLPVDLPALSVDVQKINCSLALALAGAFLARKAPTELRDLTPDDRYQGVKNFSWPGRFEIVVDGSNEWFLDGAHNELSIKHAAQWFGQKMAEKQSIFSCPRILIFTHINEERDGGALLECLAKSLLNIGVRPQYVIFTSYQERQDGSTRIDKTFKAQETSFPDLSESYTQIWTRIDAEAIVESEPSIEGALNLAKKIGKQNKGMQTLVTGSIQLVGGALSILRPLA